MNNTAAKAKTGTYIGTKVEGTNVVLYKGVRYALAERFKAPQPLPESSEVINADKYGDAPWQMEGMRLPGGIGRSNDCLNFNIWSADNGMSGKAVYFYIYGGSQIGGSNATLSWANFVEKNPDIVVVAPNYRVGFWSSLDLSVLDGYGERESEFKYSNNLARLDLLEGLKWVSENIAAFGGDPANVTIGGHSAGSNNCTALLMMEQARGYFKKAICRASFCVDISLLPMEDAKFIARDLFSQLGVKSVNELLKVPDERILEEQNKLQERSGKGTSAYSNIESKFFSPVIDGLIIPFDYYDYLLRGGAKDVSAIFATNNGEYDGQFVDENMQPFPDDKALALSVNQNWGKLSDRGWNAAGAQKVLDEYRSHNELYGRSAFDMAMDLKNDLYQRCSAIMLASAMCMQSKIYMYYNEFNVEPGTPRRTLHGSENNVITRNWDALTGLFASDPDAERTAGMFSDMIASYIRTGDPNCASLPVSWTPYNNKTHDTLVINAKRPYVAEGVRPEDTRTLLPLYREYPQYKEKAR